MSPLLKPRYVPPSVYIHGAKLSAKIIALITILVIVTVFFSSCLCYICIKRRRIRKRRLERERERADNRQLKPRINRRNARFFAPGLVREGEGIGGNGGNGGNGRGWKEGLRGKVDRGVLERWNLREREFERESRRERERGSLDKYIDSEVQEIEMRDFRGAGARVGDHGGSGREGRASKWGVQMPERAWLRWTRR
ncbi:hypothetical protein BKA61DRAFT_663633 [Leptodontidium sp. MPI-SDFR-AT-0119]|nr:hypothetical protein BKA61DRAFT_663633 [Leptodontidium sp. MPI-SDFR-AT-0119]